MVNGPANPLARDLDHVLAHTERLWEDVRGQRIFITGGTGFFGCWLLESFVHANDSLALNAQATVLTRRPDLFRERVRHLGCDPSVDLWEGDVRSFRFPKGTFSHVIHAAAESSTGQNEADPLAMLETLVDGTRRSLEFAIACGARRFLLSSSGAVYGAQPADLSHVPEDFAGGPDSADRRSAYAEGKRAAETLCAVYAHRYGLHTAIARGFAFIGPYLPTDAHFAAGNFIRDAMDGGPIRVNGDGTPFRSYLYGADLAIWLWTILLRAPVARPYNVGSADAVTVEALAGMVAASARPPARVAIARRPGAGARAHRYVPDIRRAEVDLGLRPLVSLPDAIDRTLAWHSNRTIVSRLTQ